MNKILTKFTVAGVISAMCLGMTSCNDELDLAPIDYPGAGSFWTTQTQYTTNIYALSQMFRANYASNILFWAGELRAGTLDTDLINGSGALNVDYIDNLYNSSHTQFSNFGQYWGFIADLNELIYHCENEGVEILQDNVREGLLAIAYGWRAFCYFQMYRMYGGVPLRTTPDVVLGETNPEELRKPRATAEETLNFIKEDIAKSLQLFTSSNYSFGGQKRDYYWSKAATEMLAGEVYLWSGKVSTDDHTANSADVATAKTYFENVLNNYGYRMLDNYLDIWTTPHNSESIYSICYTSQEDGYTASNIQAQMIWSKAAGAGTTAWSLQDETGLGLRTDGAANRFEFFSSDATETPVQYSTWLEFNPSPNRYMYKNQMFYQYEEKDSRRKMFFPLYKVTAEEEQNDVVFIENFDPHSRTLLGTFFLKLKPSLIKEWSQSYIFNNDMPIYRLPLAILYLAEIANYEGNNADVEKYINMVRQRAFGDEWDEDLYGYKAGSFRANENAVLREKDREFIMEGQRWWDLVRLTAVKGGSTTDHFVFQPESCAGFGLDVANHPWFTDRNGNPVVTDQPVLSTSEAHKILWPIDATLLGSDPLIKQNPGYE